MTFMLIMNPTEKDPVEDSEAADHNHSFDKLIQWRDRTRKRENNEIPQRVRANAFSSKVLQKRSKSLVEENKAPSVIRVAHSFRIK